MEKINSCPFCGGIAEVKTVTRHIKNNLIVVKCTMCGASTKTFNDNRESICINAWNRRVETDGME